MEQETMDNRIRISPLFLNIISKLILEKSSQEDLVRFGKKVVMAMYIQYKNIDKIVSKEWETWMHVLDYFATKIECDFINEYCLRIIEFAEKEDDEGGYLRTCNQTKDVKDILFMIKEILMNNEIMYLPITDNYLAIGFY